MKSKTAFCNRGIFWSDIKRLWWAPALFALYMILEQPLAILNQMKYWDYAFYEQRYLYISIVPLYYCFPIVLAALLFRYLHTGKASQFFHTLPVTRGELLRTKWISLLVMTSLPILLNWGIMIGLYYGTQIGDWYQLSQIHAFFGGILVNSLALCGIASFAASVTGNTVGMIAASVGLPVLPWVAQYGISFLMCVVLKGFVSFPRGLDRFCYHLIPSFDQFSWPEAAYPLAEFILFAALGAFLYRRYAVERSGDLITATWLRPFFAYGASLGTAILGMAYFYHYSYSTGAVILFTVLAGALGFFLAEAMMKRTLRVLSSWKKFAVFAVTAAAICTVISLDWFGFNNLPAANEVASISYGGFLLPTTQEKMDELGFYYDTSVALLSQPENVQKTLQLMETLKHQERETNEIQNRSCFNIRLKNGRVMSRAYYVYDGQDSELLDCREARISRNAIFRKSEEDILSIRVNLVDPEEPLEFTLRTPEAIHAYKEAVEQDLLEQSRNADPYCEVAITFGGDEKDKFDTQGYLITDGTHVRALLEAREED